MNEPRSFRPRVFLFRTLAAVFAVEAAFLGFAFWKCSLPVVGTPTPLLAARCPNLGDRSSEVFSLAVATVLSLLTGVRE